MKKIIIAAALLFVSKAGFCNAFTDQFQTVLFGHVETIAETTTRGATYAELLGTPIQIGKMGGQYLLGLDAGVLGNIAPEAGQSGFNWTYGIHLHLSPLLKKYVFTNISADYPAINGLELNPRVSIDKIDGHNVGTFGFAAGYAWGGTPLQ